MGNCPVGDREEDGEEGQQQGGSGKTRWVSVEGVGEEEPKDGSGIIFLHLLLWCCLQSG